VPRQQRAEPASAGGREKPRTCKTGPRYACSSRVCIVCLLLPCTHSVATSWLIVKKKIFLTCGHAGATLWLVVRAKRKTKMAVGMVRPLKNAVVRMRIPAEQKQALVEAAAREGLELSTWLRRLALRAAGLLPESERRQ